MINHPFMNAVSDLTIEQIQAKLQDLNRKLNYASASGNEFLVNQIKLAMGTLQQVYSDKTAKSLQDAKMSDVINIE